MYRGIESVCQFIAAERQSLCKRIELRPCFSQVIGDYGLPIVAELRSQHRAFLEAAVYDSRIFCKIHLAAQPHIGHGFRIADTQLNIRVRAQFGIGSIKLHSIEIQNAVLFKLKFNRANLRIAVQAEGGAVLQGKTIEDFCDNAQTVLVIQRLKKLQVRHRNIFLSAGCRTTENTDQKNATQNRYNFP